MCIYIYIYITCVSVSDQVLVIIDIVYEMCLLYTFRICLCTV